MDDCPCISFVEVSEVLNVAKVSTQQLFFWEFILQTYFFIW